MNSSPSKFRRRNNYAEEEVRVLVEEYPELTHLRSRQWIGVRLMDLDKVLAQLPPVYKEAVILCGIVGLTVRSAGVILGVSKDTVHRRYLRGLDEVVKRMNGRK
jgi:DNA-directed RNA polymerase specialized sigma24 family protein